jgi:copper resistance protein D
VFDALTGARALHFASSAIVAGIVLFRFLIAEPAFRTANAGALADVQAYRSNLASIVWASLAVAIASGAAWLLLLATDISNRSLAEVLSDGTPLLLLTGTQFGHVWAARFCLAAILSLWLLLLGKSNVRRGSLVPCLLAALFIGSLAWSGHAGGTPGSAGDIHRACDFLHLVAAAAWLGSLPSLAILLQLGRRCANQTLATVARTATLRFSMLGTISVGTLLATGIVNTWVLVGDLPALVGTAYGRLLLVKIGLFVAMVGIAAINRFRLFGMLPDANAARHLQRNALVEFGVGLIIIAIVGVLGTLPPGVHEEMHLHQH